MSSEKPMKFNVKGNLRDLMAFTGLIKTRQKNILRASSKKMSPPFINILAQKLHPDRQYLKIKEIKQAATTLITTTSIYNTNHLEHHRTIEINLCERLTAIETILRMKQGGTNAQ
jgi:hypothetical protein